MGVLMRMRLVKRSLVALMIGLAAGLFGASLARAGSKPPNIVLLFADDLGHGDVAYLGGSVPTPHIDRLAAQGVTFTNGYVSASFCSPSRAALMTGRYQNRFGHETNPASVRDAGTPPSEILLPEMLKPLGYRSALIGKWHLGVLDRFHPFEQGFDEFFGMLHGAHTYFPAAARRSAILDGRDPVAPEGYLTDVFAERAVAFIERAKGDPFFLFLSFNAVHTPIEASPAYLARFAHLPEGDRRSYAAMTAAMDDAVGAVMAAIEAAGLKEETLVFFISDNGAVPRYGRNDPLRGGKTQYFEGGIRVPFIASWPGRLPAGRRYDEPVMAFDVVPTVVAAAGGSMPQDRVIDGVDLLPFLTGAREGAPHDILFWRHKDAGAEAARQGRWKYVKEDGEVHLFDLEADLSETKNLAAQHPDILASLRTLYAAWEAELADPLWAFTRDATTTDEQRAKGLIR